MLKCCIRLSEIPLHLYQITAGFELLRLAGKIDLEIEKLSPSSPRRLPYNMLEAQCDDKTIIFDMNDGYDNLLKPEDDYTVFYNSILNRCEFLYKRSYKEELNAGFEHPEKVKKIAPNYFVTVKGNPAHWPAPCDPGKEKLKKIFRFIASTQYFNGHYYEDKFLASPMIRSEPKILFMSRLWDPAGDYKGQISAEKSEERYRINEIRAKCIRACRREFGVQFYGGITPSGYSNKEYKDLAISAVSTKKHEYVKLMKDADILIATAGLHKSTGWKFAEYVAASKAIVSEPLYFESAGNLAEGTNYLSFASEFECCEKITKLFDEQKRYEMMKANADYYKCYMNCESLVSRAMQIS